MITDVEPTKGGPDTVCQCNHWYEEHDNEGECFAPGCECPSFVFAPGYNTYEAIANRGGDPLNWPLWMLP